MDMNNNDNKRAIKAVFGSKARLRAIVDDALSKLYDDLDEDSSFEEAVGQFCYDFDSIAAEHVAEAVLEVDLTHYYLRNHRQMESGDVQQVIDKIQFKDRDRCVNQLLGALHKGDLVEAQLRFTDLLARQQADFPYMTPADFRGYLIAVNREMGGAQGINDAIQDLQVETNDKGEEK
jgi:hypothetical protein